MGDWLCLGLMVVWGVSAVSIEFFKWRTAMSKERRFAKHAEFYSKHCEGCVPCDEHDCPDEDDENEQDVKSSEG